MDEVAFLRAYNNTRTLIDSARETGDTAVVVHLCNALLTMLAMIDSLNQRLAEVTSAEDEC